MTIFPQLLVLATISIARSDPTAKSSIPLASSAKTFYHNPSKISFGSFQTFGASFATPGSPILAQSPIPPSTIQSFAQAGGGFSGGFSKEIYSQPDRGSVFPQINENVPPIGENFLRINQNARPPGPGFPPVNPSRGSPVPVFPAQTADRRQGFAGTPPGTSPFGAPGNGLEDLLEQEWSTFKTSFNKTYASFEEERQRREIFIENRNKVARFNQEYGTGRNAFVQRLNQYADLLNHEFGALVNGLNRTRRGSNAGPEPERRPSSFIPAANVNIPSMVDWREAGAVAPVRRQGICGACYAFAAAGALEGQNFRKTGSLVELSPQNLIDCTESYTNSGCTGGLMEFAFEYVRDNRGIDTENTYPFEERDGLQCRYRQDGYGAHDTGYVLLDEGDERALEVAVATIGPIAAGIDAHPDSFQFYSNGVYFEPQCSSSADQLNHAVLVVGYGTEPNGQQYWLIKNSYGPEWGIGGYMKLGKFSNNQCGIASYASYPLV